MDKTTDPNTKAKLDAERQRYHIVHDSIYGVWHDPSESIVLKITPSGSHTRIKIIDVGDHALVERISFYCGLQVVPRRTHWKGFDFVTQLVKVNKFFYKEGLVHMPNSTRKNMVNLVVTNNHLLSLDFFFIETRQKQELQKYVGSLVLHKRAGGEGRKASLPQA
ncbi:MAG: hypothetical protein JSS79_18200 [Bacteroidetes bacterium]|nr:hypothetical protein [Bacteroidota bacterium]